MIECPECGGDMIWQNDWDLDGGMLMTEYICADAIECETSVRIFKRFLNKEKDAD